MKARTLTGSTGDRESQLSEGAERTGCKPLTAGLLRCRKWLPKEAQHEESRVKGWRGMKACIVKPPGPAKLHVIFCGGYLIVLQKPSQNDANSFQDTTRMASTPTFMTIRVRPSTNNFSLSLSPPCIPDWSVVDSPRLSNPRSYSSQTV